MATIKLLTIAGLKPKNKQKLKLAIDENRVDRTLAK